MRRVHLYLRGSEVWAQSGDHVIVVVDGVAEPFGGSSEHRLTIPHDNETKRSIDADFVLYQAHQFPTLHVDERVRMSQWVATELFP